MKKYKKDGQMEEKKIPKEIMQEKCGKDMKKMN